MDSTRTPFESQTHSFLVRFWLEKAPTQDSHAVWRGHITHVASGTRRSLKHPSKVTEFIALYLYQADREYSWRYRIGRWFTRTWQGCTGRDWHV